MTPRVFARVFQMCGMDKKDLKLVIVIGAGVGLLGQPILANVFSAPSLFVRAAAFFGFLILAPLALSIAWWIGKKIPVIYQFAKFAAVGALNTFIDVGILNVEIILSGLPGGGAYYPIFKGISFLSGTTNSFFWNKYWTFKAHAKRSVAETAKFYTFATVGFALNVGMATFVVGLRPTNLAPNLWANVGAFAGVAVSFLWDFFSYKYFVFKKPAEAVQDSSKVQ